VRTDKVLNPFFHRMIHAADYMVRQFDVTAQELLDALTYSQFANNPSIQILWTALSEPMG